MTWPLEPMMDGHIDDWDAWCAASQEWDRRFADLRKEIEAALPMRRKQASLWMANLSVKEAHKDAGDLKRALKRIYGDGLRITPAEQIDLCFALGIDANAPKLARLKKYIAYLEREMAKAQVKLDTLTATK